MNPLGRMELLREPRIEPAGSREARHALLESIRPRFLGLDTSYLLADGRHARRTYLDSAASNLRLEPADEFVRSALRHYANTHSQLHFGARVMTSLYEEAHRTVLEFVSAREDYTAVFCGYGVTGCLNRVARILSQKRPERDVVITTIMEHHANDLPHRKHVGHVVHVPVEKDPDGEAGRVDMEALRRAVAENRDRLNYIAVTAASNVTGVLNPVHEIARIAHDIGALIVVDAAQSAAHLPIYVEGSGEDDRLDVVCLSGHKIYTPGSPGVIVARKEIFEAVEPQEVGGGIVSFVDTAQYQIVDALPDREETGTPNLPGSLALAATLHVLGRIGMDVVEEDERSLTQYALNRLEAIDGVHIYGSHRLEVADRIGVITFNLADLPHGLVTAVLNDYYGIAVRNECFCAQPFVRQLLGISDDRGVAPDSCFDTCSQTEQPGMVRISLGLYNTRADVDRAADALVDILSRVDEWAEHYRPSSTHNGDWVHRSFTFEPNEVIDLRRRMDEVIGLS
jgi:cysteine desulfurase / selenocysteine lyase